MILYFSATGNSAYVARRIAENTGDSALDLFGRIKTGDNTALESSSPWVIVAPTYAWRLPHIVEHILENTALGGSDDMYFVLTAGSGCGGASNYARELCARIGKRFMGLSCVVMPENYIAMFRAPKHDKAVRIVRKAAPVVDGISADIAAGRMLKTKGDGLTGRFMSTAVNRIFFGHFVRDKKFRTTDKCIGCGRCASLCPLNNIAFENGRPAWHGNCTHCMACICGCPAEAIEYGRASIGQVRYKCPE